MNLKHLHLHVRDLGIAEGFYRDWFGLTVSRRYEGLTFLTDDDRFDLALMKDDAPAAMPAWFHFGFRLPARADVAALHERMRDAAVSIVRPLSGDDALASFRCGDPDGHVIEVYWEP